MTCPVGDKGHIFSLSFTKTMINALQIAEDGALALAGLVDENGKFRYRYSSATGTELSGYNVLRHAGAIWSMLDVYSETGTELLLESSKRAITFLLDSHIRFFRTYNNLCICEDNKIKLGGNALSILALVSAFDSTGDKFLLHLSKQLGKFILSHRNEDRNFIHKRYFASGKISNFHSMYYTGEALFAILSLYHYSKDKEWLDTAATIEKQLAQEDYGVSAQSHWMLYFLEQLSQYKTSEQSYAHAQKIVCHILDNPEYLTWNRSTPIACRSEGLLAFLGMQRPPDLKDLGLRKRCFDQVTSNLTRQLEYCLSDNTFTRGGNDRRDDEVRIDYIQHNISSFLHYYQVKKNLAL